MRAEPRIAPTTEGKDKGKMTEDEVRAMTHPPILERVQPRIWAVTLRPATRRNLVRALFNCRILPSSTDQSSAKENGQEEECGRAPARSSSGAT